MTFITHGFRVSVISDVRERVRDLGSPLRFMLRRSSLVECVSVLHGTCLQCAEFFFIHQYVQPCLSKNPKYTFYTIKSSLTLAYNSRVRVMVFQEHISYIVEVGFIGGKYRRIRKKIHIFRKSLTLSHNVVSSTSRHERDSNSQLWVVIGTVCTGSCKSTITTAPTILVKICGFFRLMMFHATFNNISVLSWWSVLFEEKTTAPGENHRPVASQLVKTYISYLVII